MKKSATRTFIRAGLAASVVVGLSFALPASAASEATGAACREETRRVAIWPKGGNPKIPLVVRFEERAVKVCDGKVVSRS